MIASQYWQLEPMAALIKLALSMTRVTQHKKWTINSSVLLKRLKTGGGHGAARWSTCYAHCYRICTYLC